MHLTVLELTVDGDLESVGLNKIGREHGSNDVDNEECPHLVSLHKLFVPERRLHTDNGEDPVAKDNYQEGESLDVPDCLCHECLHARRHVGFPCDLDLSRGFGLNVSLEVPKLATVRSLHAELYKHFNLSLSVPSLRLVLLSSVHHEVVSLTV